MLQVEPGMALQQQVRVGRAASQMGMSSAWILIWTLSWPWPCACPCKKSARDRRLPPPHLTLPSLRQLRVRTRLLEGL